MPNLPEKIQANNLAPGLIGGIIQEVEQWPPKNLNWIESIIINTDNIYTISIKPKASYYPKCILIYNKYTKSRTLQGKLWEIEENLRKYYKE